MDKIERALKEHLSAEEIRQEKVPAAWIKKAKALIPKDRSAPCPHCGKAVTPFRRPVASQRLSNVLWLSVAAGAFLASFAVPRYFMQLLLVAGLAGIKAIVDLRATKTQIMIYKALSEDGSEGRHLHTHSSRL